MPAEVETIAYAGATPWHRLGKALEETDLYDWLRVCEKAGLDWDVELVALQTADTQAKAVAWSPCSGGRAGTRRATTTARATPAGCVTAGCIWASSASRRSGGGWTPTTLTSATLTNPPRTG
jgi:hypothetical protein